MLKGWRVSPFGVVVIVVSVAAVAGLLLGGHGVQVVSFVVLFVALASVAIAVVQAAGFTLPRGAGFIGSIGGSGSRGGGRSPKGQPEPEYIPEAGTPSEQTWQREEELYRRKNRPDEP